MPDLDRFRSLPRSWRGVARAFQAFARGEAVDVDQRLIGRAFARALGDGVPTLEGTVKLFEQLSAQPPLSPELGLEQLAQATRGVPLGRNDCLLGEEAERMITRRNYDPRALTTAFLCRHLCHNVIDAKGGVADVLHREGVAVDRDLLLQEAAPAINVLARQLSEHPTFKRIRLGSTFNRPVDLEANLLGRW